MSQRATQDTRHIAVGTPLGKDVLLLRGFSGHEEVSRLFDFELDLLSEEYEVAFDDIVGQNITLGLELPGGGMRFWNGYVNTFTQGQSDSSQFAVYRATMVPWLWLLTRTSDCRIFQGKSVPDIIKELCGDFGFSDIEDRLSGSYSPWTYCVQYRETAFNFISRLMEQEGIYYYFSHEEGKHTLVLCDSLSKHDPYGNYAEIDYSPDVSGSSLEERITSWTVRQQVQPGKFAHTDYNFTTPTASLLSTQEDVKGHSQAEYEIFDFPGEHADRDAGDQHARVRMEELAHPHERCMGRGETRGIAPGHTFALAGHSREDQNRENLVLSANYSASAQPYESSGGGSGSWACRFTVMPADAQFRPARSTPKPVVQGAQTAVVTGPAGETIWPDEYGRVKVQFHWDRYGKKDENSSCWIRVSEAWAGATWGTSHVPHVGQEVIISFLEGDPDQPLLTGRVYNADNMPALSLPGEKEKTVVCRDHYGNEIVFDAAAGTIRIHSPTHTSTINLGKSIELKTLSNWINEIVGDCNETINGCVDRLVGGNTTRNVAGNNSDTVGGDEKREIVGNMEVKLGADLLNMFCGMKHETLIGLKSELIGGYKNELVKGTVTAGHFGTKFEYGNSKEAKKAPLHVRSIGKLYYGVKGAICEKASKCAIDIAEKYMAKASEIEQNCSGDMTMKCAVHKMSADKADTKCSKWNCKASKWAAKASNAKINAKLNVKNGAWTCK